MTTPLGLSQNAWRSSKNWADSSFPASTVPGDRIYNTTLGGWWTWLETSPGVGWWTPAPSSLVAKVYQLSSYSAINTTWTAVNNLDGDIKNVNGWWGGNKFTPQAPGWYEFGGAIAWQVTAVDGWRGASWQLNGSGQIKHGGSVVRVVTNAVDIPTVQVLPPQQVYLNGSTDYVKLQAISDVNTNTYTPGAGPEDSWRSTNIWIKYMQFES